MKYFLPFLLCFTLGLTDSAFAQQSDKLGVEYFNIGDYKKSANIFEELYKKGPNQQRYNYLRKCYIQLNRLEDAEKLCKKHFKKFKNINTKIELAQVYQKMGEDDQVQNTFDEVMKYVESNPNMAINVGQQFTRMQKFDLALECYAIARSHNPRQVLNFQMADLYSQMGDVDMVFQEYIDVLDINPGYLQSVKNMLRRMISDDPDNENNEKLRIILLDKIQKSNDPIYNDLLIWLFIQENNFESAFRHLKAEDRRSLGDQSGIWNLAKTCYNNKQWDIAIQCYDYIIETGSDSPYYIDAKIAKLKVLRDKIVDRNDYTEEDISNLQSQYLLTLTEFGSNAQTVMLMRDLAHLQAFYLDDTESAKGNLESAIKITNAAKKHIAFCKLELADILLLENEVWDAILLYAQVEKDFKEDVIGQEAKFRRAKVNYYQGDFNWAQAQLDVLKASTSKLIANDAMYLSLLIGDNLNLDTTDRPLLLYARADLMVYQGRMELAWQKLDSLETLYPSNGLMDEVKFMRANIRIQQRNWEEAAKYYQEVVDHYSWDLLGDDAHFKLAELYEFQLGNSKQAMDLYEQLIIRYPGSIYTVEARKRFRKLRGDISENEG